jgi:hypothetical protein
MPGQFVGLRTDTLPWIASNNILRAMRNSTIASPGCFARLFVVFPRIRAFPGTFTRIIVVIPHVRASPDTFARIFADYPRKYRRIPHVIPENAITCGHFPHVITKIAVTCGQSVFDSAIAEGGY